MKFYFLNNFFCFSTNTFSEHSQKELRNLKKSSAQNISMESSEEEDEFTIAQNKILKLKMMLDNGIITQEDFDAKKAEILSTI